MSLKIIFREFNENEDGLRFYVSNSPLDLENLPAPLAETGPSNTLTDESTEHGDHAVSHTVPWDITEQAYVKVVAHRNGSEVASQQWEYEPGEQGSGGEEDFSTAEIGDYIGGGVYAGINTESDGTQYHIVFALQEGELSSGSSSRWKVEGTTTPGSDSDSDGWANTLSIEAAGLEDHPAALYCRNYEGGGYSDWYLPAINELGLEANLRGHEELSLDTGDRRWSSTETSSDRARTRNFQGSATNTVKTLTISPVRPIRRVPVAEEQTVFDGSDFDGLTFAAMEAAGNYDSSTDTGFFGEVPASTLFTGPEIKSELDITEGTAINDEEPWLKFWSKGKVLYVNKKPIQRSISRDHIDSRGAVFGTEVVKNGAIFKARLLTGAASDPIDTSNQGSTDSCTYGLGAGSEWNELIYRVHSDVPFCGDPEHGERHGGAQIGENWASYSDSDLGIGTGAGRWNWTQETPLGATSNGIRRGGTDSVAHFNHTISDRSWSEFGLRLVLELVDEPLED